MLSSSAATDSAASSFIPVNNLGDGLEVDAVVIACDSAALRHIRRPAALANSINNLLRIVHITVVDRQVLPRMRAILLLRTRQAKALRGYQPRHSQKIGKVGVCIPLIVFILAAFDWIGEGQELEARHQAISFNLVCSAFRLYSRG